MRLWSASISAAWRFRMRSSSMRMRIMCAAAACSFSRASISSAFTLIWAEKRAENQRKGAVVSSLCGPVRRRGGFSLPGPAPTRPPRGAARLVRPRVLAELREVLLDLQGEAEGRRQSPPASAPRGRGAPPARDERGGGGEWGERQAASHLAEVEVVLGVLGPDGLERRLAAVLRELGLVLVLRGGGGEGQEGGWARTTAAACVGRQKAPGARLHRVDERQLLLLPLLRALRPGGVELRELLDLGLGRESDGAGSDGRRGVSAGGGRETPAPRQRVAGAPAGRPTSSSSSCSFVCCAWRASLRRASSLSFSSLRRWRADSASWYLPREKKTRWIGRAISAAAEPAAPPLSPAGTSRPGLASLRARGVLSFSPPGALTRPLVFLENVEKVLDGESVLIHLQEHGWLQKLRPAKENQFQVVGLSRRVGPRCV